MDIKQKLLSEYNSEGYWEGRLSSSALSTATATFAIYTADKENNLDVIKKGLKWLTDNVNEDGGWGDTVDSESNLSTTLLVWSTFSITDDLDIDYCKIINNAESWIKNKTGDLSSAKIANAVLEHYGNDRTFSVPILLMCAIAGRLGAESMGHGEAEDRISKSPNRKAWRLVPQLPFELSILPHFFFRLIKLPVVSYALPALITMGIARHNKFSTWFFPWRIMRNLVKKKALGVLAKIQPPNGGFLEATPLTSFVLMSLVPADLADIPVAKKCLEFLLESVREDGSWPIDTNLATWLTTLSVKALDPEDLREVQKDAIRSWLLKQQFRERHPYTNAAPGGWAWTDLPGGTPDADDTSGALLALKKLDDGSLELKQAVSDGLKWLIDMQNDNGGIPTFCKGWGKLPFDRSCPDITAHALQAFIAWEEEQDEYLQTMIKKAEMRCIDYLKRSQKKNGSWIPLWFGNQSNPDKTNPVYGTSQVLIGLVSFLRTNCENTEIKKLYDAGSEFLRNSQIDELTLEEMALSAKALSYSDKPEDISFVENVCNRLSDEKEIKPSPIGLYFASLWYSEKLYPIIFSADAMKLRGSKGRKVERSEGRKVGRSEGRKVGRSEGRKVGRSEGRKVGRSEGRKVGRKIPDC